MDTTDVFSSKADKYAKYRWSYASRAIQTIFDVTHLSADATVADIGSGTGILTRHFVERVEYILAVEPNPRMRGWAVRSLSPYSSFHSVDGRAEVTTLAEESIDLIVVGTALHWFEPQATKREFLRILKPGGWLATLGNWPTDVALKEALGEACSAENGWGANETECPPGKPVDYYYDGQEYIRRHFPGALEETWEAWFGAIVSHSAAPDEDSPLYGSLERSLRGVFDRFSAGGQIRVHYSTELCLGRMKSSCDTGCL